MSMRVGGKQGGAIADINVTPMADIMIVLLIIFMVITPMVVSSPVPLPRAANTAARSSEGLKVVVTGTGTISVGTTTFASAETLRVYLSERLAGSAEAARPVLVQADKDVAFAEVSRILEICRAAGAEEVGLAADRKVGS
jgi:biopolymer transport protein TolR